MWLFKKKSNEQTVIDPFEINGVCLGWDAKPHLSFKGGTYLPTDAERVLYPEYFKNGDWPTDPITGEKLPIAYP